MSNEDEDELFRGFCVGLFMLATILIGIFISGWQP